MHHCSSYSGAKNREQPTRWILIRVNCSLKSWWSVTCKLMRSVPTLSFFEVCSTFGGQFLYWLYFHVSNQFLKQKVRLVSGKEIRISLEFLYTSTSLYFAKVLYWAFVIYMCHIQFLNFLQGHSRSYLYENLKVFYILGLTFFKLEKKFHNIVVNLIICWKNCNLSFFW